LRLGRGLLPVCPGEDGWHRAVPYNPPDAEQQPATTIARHQRPARAD
jgi:hypothetical protein